MHFLAELGVVPQTSNAKTDRTNRLKADLFYKLNKWVRCVLAVHSCFITTSCIVPACRLSGTVCIVSCCPKLLELAAHLLSMLIDGIVFGISLCRVSSEFSFCQKPVCTLTSLVISAALLCGCSSYKHCLFQYILALGSMHCERRMRGFPRCWCACKALVQQQLPSPRIFPNLYAHHSLDCAVSLCQWLSSLLYHSRDAAFSYLYMQLKAFCCHLGIHCNIPYGLQGFERCPTAAVHTRHLHACI